MPLGGHKNDGLHRRSGSPSPVSPIEAHKSRKNESQSEAWKKTKIFGYLNKNARTMVQLKWEFKGKNISGKTKINFKKF